MEKLKLSQSERENYINALNRKLEKCNKVSAFNFSIKDYIKEDFKNVKKPTIIIEPHVYVAMMELVKQNDVECSWHCLVHRNLEDMVFTLYELLVFPQINSGAATATDDEEYERWMAKFLLDENFPIEDLRMHGHSHVNMAVFSSSTDDAYQKDILTNIKDGDYYIFMILNKKMEIAIYLYDLNQQIMFDTKDINLQIRYDSMEDIRSWVASEIKEKCIKKIANKKPLANYSKKNYVKDYEKQESFDFDPYDPLYDFLGEYKKFGGKNGLK